MWEDRGSLSLRLEVGRGDRERLVDVKTRTTSACYANRCVLSCLDTRLYLGLYLGLYSDPAWCDFTDDVTDDVTDIRRGEI